jgi:hypothetical protein
VLSQSSVLTLRTEVNEWDLSPIETILPVGLDYFLFGDDPLGTTFDLLRWFNGQLAALLTIAKRYATSQDYPPLQYPLGCINGSRTWAGI